MEKPLIDAAFAIVNKRMHAIEKRLAKIESNERERDLLEIKPNIDQQLKIKPEAGE